VLEKNKPTHEFLKKNGFIRSKDGMSPSPYKIIGKYIVKVYLRLGEVSVYEHDGGKWGKGDAIIECKLSDYGYNWNEVFKKVNRQFKALIEKDRS